MVCVSASFLGGVFLGKTRVLAIRQEGKIDLGFSSCCGRILRVLVNLKCSWYDRYFFDITRFPKDNTWFLKQRSDLRAKLVRSLTKIFCRVDDNLTRLHLTKYKIFKYATYPVHGSFAMMGFIIMPINQQIGTVGGNKLKDKARPELRCMSALCVFPLLWLRNEEISTLLSVNDRCSHWSNL